MSKIHLLIGIDDTDNPRSHGTGMLCRELGRQLEKTGLGKIENITHHQLLQDKKLGYTNRNNAACIEVVACNTDALIKACKEFIIKHSAKGSCPGMVVSSFDEVPPSIIDFGLKAKTCTLKAQTAIRLAEDNGILCIPLSSNNQGVIGAMAAVGLRASGNDGRVIWVKGKELDEMEGTYIAGEVYCQTRVDSIRTIDGFKVPVNARIKIMNPTVRPVLKDNVVTLLVEEVQKQHDSAFETTPDEYTATATE